MKKICVLAIFGVLLGVGCGSDIEKKSGSSNPNNILNPNNPDNSTNPPKLANNVSNNGTNNPIIIVEPVEGEVSLVVQVAQQIGGSSYALDISIANGLEESISIAPTTFRIGAGALELTSVNTNQSTCASGALLSPDGTVNCTLVFDNVEGTPDRLIYTGAGELVVAAFTPRACEMCGGNTCVDIQTNRNHCGECHRAVVDTEICEGGVIKCEEGYRLMEGFCVYDEEYITLRNNPLNGNTSCFEVCGEASYCEGVLAHATCPEGQGFGGQERSYPGLQFCEATGSDARSLAQSLGCTVQAIFCACYDEF